MQGALPPGDTLPLEGTLSACAASGHAWYTEATAHAARSGTG